MKKLNRQLGFRNLLNLLKCFLEIILVVLKILEIFNELMG